MASLKQEQLTSQEPPQPDSLKRTVYSPPPSVTKLMRLDTRLDLYRFEGRKQILADKYAIEILPTVGSNRLDRGVVVHDGDVTHMGKHREAIERFSPKLSVCLVELWPNGQGL